MNYYDRTHARTIAWSGYLPKPKKHFCRNKGCFKPVSDKVAKFSKEKLGVVLCWDCQRIDEGERSIQRDDE